MEISERISQFKYHIAGAAGAAIAVVALVTTAPSLVDVLVFFWPLLVSTALFVVSAVVFGRFSPPPVEDASGERFLDYVAGQTPESLPGDGYKFYWSKSEQN